AAWNTIAAELAKPTSTVTKPAAMADAELSRHRRANGDSAGMGGLWGKGGGSVAGRTQQSFRLAPHNARLRAQVCVRGSAMRCGTTAGRRGGCPGCGLRPYPGYVLPERRKKGRRSVQGSAPGPLPNPSPVGEGLYG